MEDNTEDNLEQAEGQEAMPIASPSGTIAGTLAPFLPVYICRPVTYVEQVAAMHLKKTYRNGEEYVRAVDMPDGGTVKFLSDYPPDELSGKLQVLFSQYCVALESGTFLLPLRDVMHFLHEDVKRDKHGRVIRDEQGNETPVDGKTYKNRFDYLRDRCMYSYYALYGTSVVFDENYGEYDKKLKKKPYNTMLHNYGKPAPKSGKPKPPSTPEWRIVNAYDPNDLIQNAALYVSLATETYNDYMAVVKQIGRINPEAYGLSGPAFAMYWRMIREAGANYTLDKPQSHYVETLYVWAQLPDYWEQIDKDKAAIAEGKTPRLHYNEEYAYPYIDTVKEIQDAGLIANVTYTDKQGHPLTYGMLNPRAYPQKNEKHDAPLMPEDYKKLLGHKKLFTGTASPDAIKMSYTFPGAPHIARPPHVQAIADKKTDSKAKDDGKAAKQPDDSTPET